MTRLQGLGIGCVLLLSIAVTGYGVLESESVPFLLARGDARWITLPVPVDTGLRRVGPGHAQAAAFLHEFEMERAGTVQLRARALGRLRVRIDDGAAADLGDPLAAGAPCLKHVCSLPAQSLAAGRHTLRAEVVNATGPPVLWLELDGAERPVVSSDAWEVAPLRASTPLAERHTAIVADDTRPLPESRDAPTPLEAARGHALPLGLVFALAVVGSCIAQRRAPLGASRLEQLPAIALAVVGLFWIHLFAVKFAQIPLRTGFDVQGHLEYVRFLLERGALPKATDGWSMYHPPAFYAAVAALVALFDPLVGSIGERLTYRALPALFGFGQAAVALGLARSVFRREPVAQALCVLFAGILPLNITIAAYFSNESGHAFAFALSIWLAVRAMGRGSLSPRAGVLLAVALGVALLSKFTALGLVPIVCFFVGFERWQARGDSGSRALAVSAAVAGGALVVSGWYYLRNWLLFGDPFVWNNDLLEGSGYWSLPGFHTASYFTSFGAALSHPFFASFESFWDGLYTTLWGDGLVAGFASYRSRPATWSWSLMSASYLFALPLTLLAMAGYGACVRDSLRGPDPSRRVMLALLTTLLFALGVAMVWKNLTLPYYGAARASYSLCLAAPFAICLARGITGLDRRLASLGSARLLPRAVLHACIAMWVLLVAATYAG